MGGRTLYWGALCVGLIGLTGVPAHAASTCETLYQHAHAYLSALKQQSAELEEEMAREFGADADSSMDVMFMDPLAALDQSYAVWQAGTRPTLFHQGAANAICFAATQLSRMQAGDTNLKARAITDECIREIEKLRLIERLLAGEPKAKLIAEEDQLRSRMAEKFRTWALPGMMARRAQLCGDLWRWADYYQRRDLDADATATLLQEVFKLFAHKAKERYPSLRLPWDDTQTFGESEMAGSLVDSGLVFPTPLFHLRDDLPPGAGIFTMDEVLAEQSVWSLRQFDDTLPPVTTSDKHLEGMCQLLTARLVRFYEARNRQRQTMTALAEWQVGSSSLADLRALLPRLSPLADQLERAAADPTLDQDARQLHGQARDAIAERVREFGEALRALEGATKRNARSIFVDSETGVKSREGAPRSMRADKLLDKIDGNLAKYRADLEHCSADTRTALQNLIAREEGRRNNILEALGDAVRAERRRVTDLNELLDQFWRDAPRMPPVDAEQAAATLDTAKGLAEEAHGAGPGFEDYAASADRFVAIATKWTEDAPTKMDISAQVEAFATLSSDLARATEDLAERSELRQAVAGLVTLDEEHLASFDEAAGQLADLAGLIETRLTNASADRDRLLGELARHDHELLLLVPRIIELRTAGAQLARRVFEELDAGPETGVMKELEQLSKDLAEAGNILGELDAKLENLGQITELVKDGERGLELVEGLRERVDLMASTIGSVKSGVDTATDWVALKESLLDADPDNPAAFISATLRAVKTPAERTGPVAIALVPFLEFYASAAEAAGQAAVSLQAQLMDEGVRLTLNPAPEYHLYTPAEVGSISRGMDDRGRDRLVKMVQVRRLLALVKAQSLNDARDRPAR